ncbi:MAG: hypothetical protein R3B84_13650 [Zavarzinella sp.]
MTQREKTLSIILLGAMLFFVGGALGYFVVLSPIMESKAQIKKLNSDIEDKELAQEKIYAQQRQMKALTEQSLPNDVPKFRGIYSEFLARLFRQANFETGTVRIISKDPDEKSAPKIPTTKKYAYTRLIYEVAAQGDLYHLVDFMQMFYGQPVLHNITKLTVSRPSEAKLQSSRELTISMTVEALVMDGAPNRPTLFPLPSAPALLAGGGVANVGITSHSVTSVGPGAPQPIQTILASPSRPYLAVAGANPFYGPPPKPEPPKPEEKKTTPPPPPPEPSPDETPYVYITSIIGDDAGLTIASLWDRANNYHYSVVKEPSGNIYVESYFMFEGSRSTLHKTSREIVVGSTKGLNMRRFRVWQVNDDSLLLEEIEQIPADVKELPKLPAQSFVAGGLAQANIPTGRVGLMTLDEPLSNLKKVWSMDIPEMIYPRSSALPPLKSSGR